MDNQNQHLPDQDSRTGEYNQPNDRVNFMTDLDRCIHKLEADGYRDQFKVEKGKLNDLSNKKKI